VLLTGRRPGVLPLPPLSPRVYLQRRSSRLPFPLDQPGCRLFSRARHGLLQGVRAVGLSPGDEVLVPAYHHGSEVQALVEAGLRCRFYEATMSLAPDHDELESLLGPRVRALHLVHYLGFPQDAPRWRAWCDARGLVLIEDAAQSWLASWQGRPVGSFGDLAIFCVYKSFGVPDGALLVSSRPAPAPGGRRRSGAREVLARHRQWLQQFAWRSPGRSPRPEPAEPYDPVLDFALGDVDAPPAGLSVMLLPKVARTQAARARRRNYRYLLERLPGTATPLFGYLPEGAVPFVFPVASADKAGLLRRLRQHGIDALDFWSVPHPSLPAERFPRAGELRASVVGLPVHQELRQVSLRRMVTALWSAQEPSVPT